MIRARRSAQVSAAFLAFAICVGIPFGFSAIPMTSDPPATATVIPAAPGPTTTSSTDSARAADKAQASAGITWAMMRPHFKAALYIVREGSNRWGITAKAEGLPPSDPDRSLRLAAVEALGAAHDDIAWVVGEVLNDRIIVMQATKAGDTLRLREEYVDALIDNRTFATPLRRFTDAVLRARGLTCSDCLTGVSESRNVTWPEVRLYIEEFIHVNKVGSEGRVDLHIATAENRIPEFHASHHDLAAAVYAAMHAAVGDSADFQSAVQENLNELLTGMADSNPESIRSSLNLNLPPKILKDPRCLAPILAHLPEALERHSLHCIDCPAAR